MSDLVIPPALTPLEPGWQADLDAATLIGDPKFWPREFEVWHITDDGGAEWAMRFAATLTARVQEVKAQAKVWRAPIDLWQADQLRALEPALHRFTVELEMYTVDRREQTGETTLALPSGSVSTRRATKPSIDLNELEEEQLIAWAAENLSGGEYETVVKTVEHVLISELRKLVELEARGACTGCGMIVPLEDVDGDAHDIEVRLDDAASEPDLVKCGPVHAELFVVLKESRAVVPHLAIEMPTTKPTVKPTT